MDNRHDSDCATHNPPAYPAGPCDCLPTQAMCRAAVVYANGADVYERGVPDKALEIEESIYAEVWKAMQAAAPAVVLQGGMNNAELSDAWAKKLPGVVPTDREMTSFALGVEVGVTRARDLERQDWSRVHHALAKHGEHPGRTDDHLADVIDRALARLKTPNVGIEPPEGSARMTG